MKIFIRLNIISCNTNQKENNAAVTGDVPFVKFETKKHNFGTISLTEQATFNFEFENTGNSDLVIQKVDVTCGCTVPEWTTTPVGKGEKGFIKVTFHSKGITGKFSKSIFVKSNAQNDVVLLKIEGNVFEQPNLHNRGSKSRLLSERQPAAINSSAFQANKVYFL